MIVAIRGRSRSVGREALHWSLCLLVAVIVHLALAASFYEVQHAPHNDMPLLPPAAPILMELAPLPVASKPTSVESVRAVAERVPRPKTAVPQKVTDATVKEVTAATVRLKVGEKVANRDEDVRQDEVVRRVADRQPPKEAQDAPSQVARKWQPDNSSEQRAQHNQAPQVGAASAAQTQAKIDWESQLLARLQQAKRYPAYAIKSRQEDLVLVRFTVDRDGRVLSSAIVQSRGYELLERESLALLQRVSPLPRPPAALIEGNKPLEMVVPIEFFIRNDS